MNLAHSQLRAHHWCSYCEIPLLDDEVDQVELPAEQGCAGAMTLYRFDCKACGHECAEYEYQDERETYDDESEAVQP